MRAAYANGVLSAFETAGHRPWDLVLGTSAGGALAAWYAAGQARFAERTWDFAADRAILSYRRYLLGRGPLLDHEFLLENVYRERHPIDEAAIHRAPFPVVVTATRVRDGHATYHDLREGPVIPWLKATGRLPFAAGPPVDIQGELYLDGGIADPIPVRHAIETRGMDHVVLLLNSPAGPRRRDNAVLSRITARRFPSLRNGILAHQARKEAAVAYALTPPPAVRIDIVRPAEPTGLHRLTRDLGLLHDAIEHGRRDGQAYLAGQRDTDASDALPVVPTGPMA